VLAVPPDARRRHSLAGALREPAARRSHGVRALVVLAIIGALAVAGALGIAIDHFTEGD
jgi:hypothetical protein